MKKSLGLLMFLVMLIPFNCNAESESVDILLEKSKELRLELSAASRNSLTINYRQDEVNDIFVKPGFLTDISLEAGEKLERVILGNEILFDVTTYLSHERDGCDHIYVNPKEKHAETNMVILSDRRNYQAKLISGDEFFPTVKWSVDTKDKEKTKLRLEVRDISDLYFAYSMSKQNQGINIFDDKSHRTYLVFAHGKLDSTSPLIFTDNNGVLEIIPYEKMGNVLVMEQILKNFALKINKTIFKIHRK